MEPMITGSPSSPERTGNFATPSQTFLPSLLLGSRPDGRPAFSESFTDSASRQPLQNRVTWSPELNRTNYFDSNLSFGQQQQQQQTLQFQSPSVGPPLQSLSGANRRLERPLFDYDNRPADDSSINNSFFNLPQCDDGSSMFEKSSKFTDADQCCVTIFGFQRDSVQQVLQEFSQWGTIIAQDIPNRCNWLNVKYQSKLQARKAIEKNGRILDEFTRIGVIPCTDQGALSRLHKSTTSVSVDATNRVLSESFSNTQQPQQKQQSFLFGEHLAKKSTSFSKEPRHVSLARHSSLRYNETPKRNMRSLVSSNVIQESQANTGLLAKAKNYVFGW